jgi:hypothetical protein
MMVVSFIGQILLTQKAPDPTSSKPGNVETSTAEEGGNIPVLFGTRHIATQNIVWYGDIRILPVKKSSGGKKI